MQSDEELFQKAKKLHISGKIQNAQVIYLKLLKKNSESSSLLFLIGSTYVQLHNFQKAKNYLNSSIKLNENFAESYNCRGIIFAEEKDYHNAIKDYDKAISLKPNYFDAYLNKANTLKNINEFGKSLEYFNFCIKLEPENFKVYNNLGNLFINLKNYKKAKECYDKAIKLNKNFAEAYNNRGELLQLRFNEFEKAIKDFNKAFELNKNIDFIEGKKLHAKMILHDWEEYNKEIEIIQKGIDNQKKTIYPFALMALLDDPINIKKVTELYIGDNLLNTKKPKKNDYKDKINLGYFSAEFENHPVMHLMLDVFKNHNNSKFNIYAFSLNSKEDNWTRNLKKYFNKFIDASNISDKEIKILSKELDIDIAINLTGHTLNARNSIFFNRVAPIQINYLGYPGTMGSKIFDYIIADKIIVPKENVNYYSEKVIYLPNCYQANQEKIEFTSKRLDKKDFNLPDNHFIFGCFNNSYKITPSIFKSWMNILKKCEKSVLWLLENNKKGRQNLYREAEINGVKKNRIIFAERMPTKEHLKRLKFIDLFLDTFPYNAHTTASEAIRMGVPILTLKGKSFASRVASSILTNVGLENLITSNNKDYENKAIFLANNIQEIKNLKKHLKNKINTHKLFDSKTFTKDLEKIYTKILNQ